MTVFKFGRGMSYGKFIHQVDGMVIDFIDGCLIDSLLVAGKRGIYFLKETFRNANNSVYTVYFGAYGTDAENEVNAMWDQFADAVGVA